eukprot:150053_1
MNNFSIGLDGFNDHTVNGIDEIQREFNNIKQAQIERERRKTKWTEILKQLKESNKQKKDILMGMMNEYQSILANIEIETNKKLELEIYSNKSGNNLKEISKIVNLIKLTNN